jgi:cholesterol transport system auxiliary component
VNKFDLEFTILLAASLMATGCSILPQGPQNAAAKFVLAWEPDRESTPASSRGPAIVVASLIASAPYDTIRMAYVDQQYRLNYFAHNQWAAEPAAMLRPLVVAALEHSGGFATVSSGNPGAAGALRLDLELLNIRQEFVSVPSVGVIEVRAELSAIRSGAVIAAKSFIARVVADEDSPYGGVVAINRGVARLVAEINEFVLANSGEPR